MKRLVCMLAVLLFAIPLSIRAVFAEGSNKSSVLITPQYLADAELQLGQLDSGEDVIILSQTHEIKRTSAVQNCEKIVVCIIPSSTAETDRILAEINSIKRLATRGSGSLTDEGWYYGDSICIRSTLNYSTTEIGGLMFGRINSVNVQCTTSNSVILDNVSLRIHQQGLTSDSGRKTYESTYSISSSSTTYAPSSWLNVYWENGIGSLVGAIVTVTAHRGTSGQSTYSFANNIIT